MECSTESVRELQPLCHAGRNRIDKFFERDYIIIIIGSGGASGFSSRDAVADVSAASVAVSIAMDHMCECVSVCIAWNRDTAKH